MKDRVKELRLCAKDIATNADKLLADVPWHQGVDVVIHIENGDVPTVKVIQRYIPEEIVKYYTGE